MLDVITKTGKAPVLGRILSKYVGRKISFSILDVRCPTYLEPFEITFTKYSHNKKTVIRPPFIFL